MIWTNDTPSSGMNWTYALGEFKELWEEVRKGDIKKAINELCDVYTSLSCAFQTTTNIPLPLIWTRSAKEWIRRLEEWESIFSYVGLNFDAKYLKNGGNYKKSWKVRAAIKLAINDQL